MTFALCLQIPNALHFKRRIDILTSFVPSILFLESIFGYLVVCIIYKWSVDWEKSATPPPSLLNMLIQMFLAPGSVEKESQLYPGQSFVQVVLLLTAFICVPWLLIAKPYLIYQETKKTAGAGYIGLQADDAAGHGTDDMLEGEEEGNGRLAEADDEEGVRVAMSHWRSELISLFFLF